ncbi:tetratricopeptide repeat protein [bacterium]|nr:MAG: tetratricopeptide repeat protein [bacterium]
MAHTNFKTTAEEVDPVTGYIEKTQSFIDNNKSGIIGGVVAVLVLIGAVLGYSYYSKSQEVKAQALLANAQMYFTNSDYELALKGDMNSFTKGFVDIINDYSGTNAANLSVYYAGVCEFNLGNYDAALGYLKKYDVPSGILGVSPIALEATTYYQLGQFEDAAKTYEKAANWFKTNTSTPLYLIEAAKAHVAAGNKAKALSTINEVISEYPTGSHIAEAQRVKGMAS